MRGSNPDGARFSSRADRPWCPPSLMYNGYRVFSGGKVGPGRAADYSLLLMPRLWNGRATYTCTHPLGHNRACNGNTSFNYFNSAYNKLDITFHVQMYLWQNILLIIYVKPVKLYDLVIMLNCKFFIMLRSIEAYVFVLTRKYS